MITMMTTLETEIKSLFKGCYFYSFFTDDELVHLYQHSHVLCLLSGAHVFFENEKSTNFFILRQGKIKAYKTSSEGKEVTLHIFKPGDVFADFPGFSGIGVYQASALCLEHSEIIAINCHTFLEISRHKPEVLMAIITRFAKWLKDFNNKIGDLSLKSVHARLAKYLLMVSEENPCQASIPIQKKTLASILGTVPETLSRSFKKLSDEKVISVDHQFVLILDRQRLNRIAEMG